MADTPEDKPGTGINRRRLGQGIAGLAALRFVPTPKTVSGITPIPPLSADAFTAKALAAKAVESSAGLGERTAEAALRLYGRSEVMEYLEEKLPKFFEDNKEELARHYRILLQLAGTEKAGEEYHRAIQHAGQLKWLFEDGLSDIKAGGFDKLSGRTPAAIALLQKSLEADLNDLQRILGFSDRKSLFEAVDAYEQVISTDVPFSSAHFAELFMQREIRTRVYRFLGGDFTFYGHGMVAREICHQFADMTMSYIQGTPRNEKLANNTFDFTYENYHDATVLPVRNFFASVGNPVQIAAYEQRHSVISMKAILPEDLKHDIPYDAPYLREEVQLIPDLSKAEQREYFLRAAQQFDPAFCEPPILEWRAKPDKPAEIRPHIREAIEEALATLAKGLKVVDGIERVISAFDPAPRAETPATAPSPQAALPPHSPDDVPLNSTIPEPRQGEWVERVEDKDDKGAQLPPK